MKFEVTELPKRKISDLKPHPKNIEIYGEESVSDLVREIKSSRYVSPFMITQDNVIISGHRRQRACMELEIEEVEVVVRQFDNDIDILEALVRENDVREKTNFQKSNEAEALLLVEKERAEIRRQNTLKQNSSTDSAESHTREATVVNPIQTSKSVKRKQKNSPTAKSPQREEKGRATDIVAEQVGFKSGREVERAINAAKAIKEAEKSGDVEKAEILKGQLERSPSAADDLVRNWDKVDKEKLEEQKEDLKSGKKSAYGLIPREESKKKDQTDTKKKKGDEKKLDPISAILPATTYYPAKKQRITDYILAGIHMLSGFIVNLTRDFEQKLSQVETEDERQELRIALRNYLNEIEKLYEQI